MQPAFRAPGSNPARLTLTPSTQSTPRGLSSPRLPPQIPAISFFPAGFARRLAGQDLENGGISLVLLQDRLGEDRQFVVVQAVDELLKPALRR